MISGFNITVDEWQQTPQRVRTAAAALQHQLYILAARLKVYQQQNFDLNQKVERLERIEAELKAELGELKAKVVELKERLGQNSANSSLPPSSDSPFYPPARKCETSGRKKGAQAGRIKVGRRLLAETEVDRIVDLRPAATCRVCAALLLGADSAPARRQNWSW